jgi:beta-phosphoglucomutase family hydrolase
MINGFIFDMDGTMVDNMMIHHKAWQIKLKELGLELSLEEVRQTIHGKNEEILARLFGEKYTPEQRKQFADEKEAAYREVSKQDLHAIKGLENFLKEAHFAKIPMGIGTAAPPENVAFGLEKLQLGNYFSSVVDASQVSKGKPDPEVFLRVAHRIHVTIEQCLVFEDSPVGVATALNAGCNVVVITSTHTPEEFAHFPNVKKFISDYSEISLQEALNFIGK